MEPIGCPETSVTNYQFTLHNIPEEMISHLHRGGSLKSRMKDIKFRDLRLLPRRNRGIRSSGMLRGSLLPAFRDNL
jgi:hypothetical protein